MFLFIINSTIKTSLQLLIQGRIWLKVYFFAVLVRLLGAMNSESLLVLGFEKGYNRGYNYKLSQNSQD